MRDLRTETIGYFKMIEMRANDAIDQVYAGQLDEAAIALENIRNFMQAAHGSLTALAVKLG